MKLKFYINFNSIINYSLLSKKILGFEIQELNLPHFLRSI